MVKISQNRWNLQMPEPWPEGSQSEAHDTCEVMRWMVGSTIMDSGGGLAPFQRKMHSSALQAGHRGDGFRMVALSSNGACDNSM